MIWGFSNLKIIGFLDIQLCVRLCLPLCLCVGILAIIKEINICIP